MDHNENSGATGSPKKKHRSFRLQDPTERPNPKAKHGLHHRQTAFVTPHARRLTDLLYGPGERAPHAEWW